MWCWYKSDFCALGNSSRSWPHPKHKKRLLYEHQFKFHVAFLVTTWHLFYGSGYDNPRLYDTVTATRPNTMVCTPLYMSKVSLMSSYQGNNTWYYPTNTFRQHLRSNSVQHSGFAVAQTKLFNLPHSTMVRFSILHQIHKRFPIRFSQLSELKYRHQTLCKEFSKSLVLVWELPNPSWQTVQMALTLNTLINV